MSKGRLEAFSDAVIAIAMTIMALELKVPGGADWQSLSRVTPVFLAYVLSFTFLGIYWNNHHHLLHLTTRINGKILWANLHLLFWLSLIPFGTAWVGDHHRESLPSAVYGTVLLLAGVAYLILQRALVAAQGPASKIATALRKDTKGPLSAALYAAAIPLAFVDPWFADGIYVFVALIWLVPDRRLESMVHE